MFVSIRQSAEERRFISEEFQRLKAAGILERAQSPFNAPVFAVSKDPASPLLQKRYRAVFNFKPVNALFPKKPTAFPDIPSILEHCAASEWLGTADITAAFHQVPVHPEDRAFLAVTDPLSGERLRFTAWPFGFTWSPFAMEQFGRPLVEGIRGASIYMDDITTGADSLDALEDQWRTILGRCRRRGIKLNPKKTHLFRRRLHVLGHEVEAGRGYTVLPSRAKDILELNEPRNIKELERLVGVLSYVAVCIPDFARRVAPLRMLLTFARDVDLHSSRKGGRRPSSKLFP